MPEMREKREEISSNLLSFCPLSSFYCFLLAEPVVRVGRSQGDTSCWASGAQNMKEKGGEGSGEGTRQRTTTITPLPSHGFSLWVLRKVKEKERNTLDFLLAGEMSASVINWKNEREMFLLTARVWEGILASYIKQQCYQLYISSSVTNNSFI